MKKRVKLILLMSLLTLVYHSGFAQRHNVTAEIDSVQIWIGQQTKLSFTYTQQSEEFVQTPIFSDKIIDEIEIVERIENDTVQSPDGYLIINQAYLITSFADSLLLIPSFPFTYGQDTILSNELSLKVIQPFDIDLEDIQVADIKKVFKPKFSLLYLLRKSVPWLIGLILLVALVYLIYYLIKNRKKEIVEEDKLSAIPPYELAISGLDKVKQEKLWQQGRHKEYHSELTDVLRVYIEGVFDLPAMEMTSDEILSYLKDMNSDNKQVYSYLKQILYLADLVKFAKWNVGQDEHELSLKNAYSFVNETHVLIEEEVKEDDIP